jgi:DNA-binding transcriptional regulator YiaG
MCLQVKYIPNRDSQVAELHRRANAAAVAQFVAARQHLGWSRQDAAAYLGVSLHTVWRWENELTEIKGGYVIRMREAAEFDRHSIQLAAGAE